ncbi:peroxiredoxin [Pseudodesulfovibrio piezophilus]|uniref:Alkyl hydroperoxide reductase/ Thiol specific antioxidant/ Mal allergen n=1 Tax=Pseudodesulfovibrio piezophilus (strain DSM 21447 / JCM 15486 / C1TLV30) TaxID=1322246 RepID=M1WTG9_PSEP2|nr:peroxiredoxin [Pseudodesulfovibrio piezophilus]CCH49572.1 Alkyl hydroperoxide reductase/ Thiol specific antioxidant/ Mal allergen [Pseudodesulfovibrio piezophilus C1TLV30]
MKKRFIFALGLVLLATTALAHEKYYSMGNLKPRDSELKVATGDMAPDFELPSVSGGTVRLSDYRGKKNVILSFVPAAWTPVCSDQWPGYNIAQEIFEELDTVLIGISVDNTPSQAAWTESMNTITFPVLSDFWPHGGVSDAYGVLRSDGIAERALFVIDKKGMIRFIDVHDINSRPDLGVLVKALQALE